MREDLDALDIIKDFTKDDTLRFDDLLGEHTDPNKALENLLMSEDAKWEGGIFHAEDGSTSITLSVSDAMSTLTVSYQYGGDQLTQNVQLEGFGMDQILQEDVLDKSDIAIMLQTIIQAGGN
jgi:hypothetical protein